MNNRLWAYIRQQHDHSYRAGYVPLPIPEHLFTYEKED
ncbi:membrane protein [Exiguobacterium phage phiExGM16]